MTQQVIASALDCPVLGSLGGRHRGLAITDGRVARYPADISPFMAVPEDATPTEWAALARLAGPDPITLFDAPASAPSTWKLTAQFDVFQLTGPDQPLPVARRPAPDAGAMSPVRLGSADAEDMLDLVRRTEPGPFGARTVELGAYVGVRDNGRLVAMAGERLQPAGWTEISAVCTDPGYRGQGLARSLVETLIAGIHGRGERPFLHVMPENQNAIRLYLALGFSIRRRVTISSFDPTTSTAQPESR